MDTIKITAKIKRETEKAVLVAGDDYDGWLPKSQITISGNTDEKEIELPMWLAKKKGIIPDIQKNYNVFAGMTF